LPALPGSRSGIERLFDQLALVGGILSQLLALGLTLLIIKLVVNSVGAVAMGLMGRLLVLPIGSAVGFLLLASTVGPLDPEMHLLLSGLGTAALLSALGPTLRHPTLRAAGLLLLLASLASLTYSTGRLLALKASLEALPREYALARLLTTLGQTFDFLGLLWVTVWLVLTRKSKNTASDPAEPIDRERVTTIARLAITLALAVTCALLAHRGQASTANFLEVVVGRAISALAREPGPLGLLNLGPSLDVVAVLVALILLTRPTHVASTCRRAMALVLLGRCAPDIPAHCALMTAGALLLIWYAPSTLPLTVSPPAATNTTEDTET
jgi:hypothetical protein